MKDSILWIKNVNQKQKDIYSSAFMNDVDDFALTFLNNGNPNAPSTYDIIILYQEIDGTKYLTHLVRPIKNKQEDTLLVGDFKRSRMVEVIAYHKNLTIKLEETSWAIINKSPLGRTSNVVHLSKFTLKGKDKKAVNIEALQYEMMLLFRNYFKYPELANDNAEIVKDSFGDEAKYTEGSLVEIQHLVKERNREVVRKKKQQALAENKLRCEVCTFDFIAQYGQEFIECHHIEPIANGGVRETEPKDLALVCPNCHRMLHRKFDGNYLTVKELKNRFYP